MKAFLRYILSKTLRPFLENYYLKSDKLWQYGDLKLTVTAGIFHPGLFFSSKFLADYISTLDLENKKVLDVGCGSGFLSLIAAKAGAIVTSIDINPAAITNTSNNAEANSLSITTIESDLFDKIEEKFTYIFINPPYYPKQIVTHADQAWNCGLDHDYFQKFFTQLYSYIMPDTIILMVLSQTCDLKAIVGIANKFNYKMEIIKNKTTYLEELFIYEIKSV